MAAERFQRRFDILRALHRKWSVENQGYLQEFLGYFNEENITAIGELIRQRSTINRRVDALQKCIDKWEKESFSYGLIESKLIWLKDTGRPAKHEDPWDSGDQQG